MIRVPGHPKARRIGMPIGLLVMRFGTKRLNISLTRRSLVIVVGKRYVAFDKLGIEFLWLMRTRYK